MCRTPWDSDVLVLYPYFGRVNAPRIASKVLDNVVTVNMHHELKIQLHAQSAVGSQTHTPPVRYFWEAPRRVPPSCPGLLFGSRSRTGELQSHLKDGWESIPKEKIVNVVHCLNMTQLCG